MINYIVDWIGKPYMKKVIVVGGGVSGVFFSIRLKERKPDYQVIIIEHNDKLLKKLYVTGNGKCNFANKGSLEGKYYDEESALPILNEFRCEDIIEYFHSIGVESKSVGDLIYPYSESAETVANALLKRVEELNIEVHLSEDVIDYNDHTLYTDKGEYTFDALVVATGGNAAPQHGSNGKFLDTLEKKDFWGTGIGPQPSLCPIVTKENTHMLEGLRHKCKVSLKFQKEYDYETSGLHYSGDEIYRPTFLASVHTEEGEVLFKEDGLSGIVIFNIAHYINIYRCYENAEIHLDFAPNRDGEYESLVHPRLAKYLRNHNLNIHDTVFHFKKFYDFKFAQVSANTFNRSNLNDDLSCSRAKDLYFIGEAAGVYAVCGGYNIMWALASAKKVADLL